MACRKRISHWRRFHWTRPLIISGIKALRREKVPLNSSSLQKDKTSRIPEILKKAIGVDASGAKLLHGAMGYYGSWDEALRKAGIDPQKIKKHDEFWTKELVVKGILALHSAGVPLHALSMVRDNSPATKAILKEALGKDLRGLRLHSAGYRLFGGWYQAVEATGLNPENIRRDDTFWTKEVIIHSVQALYEKHVPLYIYKLSRDRSQETTEILQKIVGRPVKGSALYIAAMKKYGAWDKVLRAAGIEPYEIRNDTRLWPKKQMTNAIVALHKAGTPLCVVKIEKDRTKKTTRIIYEASKIRATGYKIYRISIRKFGSWDNALRSANLNPVEIRRNVDCLSKEYIIRAIKKLHRNKIPLNYRSLEVLENKSISNIVNPGKCRANIAMKLFIDSKKQFGSWDEALKTAGLNPKKIRRDKGFWTKQKIVDSILALNQAKVPMDCMKMQFNKEARVEKIISSTIGRKANGASLYGAVTARYGSWSSVVRAVRKNPDALGSSSRYLSGWLVQKSIRNLHKAGIPLNSKKILSNQSEEANAILRKVTEGSATTKIIYGAACKHFNTWDDALARASLDPSLIRLRGLSVKKSGKSVTHLISTIHEGGFALNASTVISNSKRIKSHNYKQVGKVVSGYSVLTAARKELGDWESALETAGLDPIEIVLKSKRKWSYSVIPHQIERIETPDGVRKVAYLGTPPKAPDEILEENLIANRLEQAVWGLPEEDRELTSKIFDLILSINGFSSQESLIKSITENLGGTVPKARIMGIFQNLAKNPELMALV